MAAVYMYFDMHTGPWNSLVGSEEDFSTLRQFRSLLGRADLSPYLRYTE